MHTPGRFGPGWRCRADCGAPSRANAKPQPFVCVCVVFMMYNINVALGYHVHVNYLINIYYNDNDVNDEDRPTIDNVDDDDDSKAWPGCAMNVCVHAFASSVCPLCVCV